MNKIKKVKAIGNIIGFNIDASGNETYNVQFPDMTIAELESYQFEEVDAYHTDEKPLYLRNVLARLRELPENYRKVWVDEIMHEFAVEKEGRYVVILVKTGQILYKISDNNYNFITLDLQKCKELPELQHTKQELEAEGFSWVFDCEGVEVQEVQEVK